ncbi:MAG: ABC transporter ATP-binding protein/permease [Alphaproteobacteria bacterium]|nr:ABC transporter ATP-binding protein/permease [Alphaproteobacteria bacterium]
MTDKNFNFPKTLLGFYVRYGARGHLFTVFIWAFMFAFVIISNGVLWPVFQKKFVSLFEQTVPDGITFIDFALPTIILITVVWLLIDVIDTFDGLISSRWRPKVQNQVSEILNDYVHHQSMAFWTNRLVGKINRQIDYVAGGFMTIRNFVHMFAAVCIIIINSGLVIGMNSSVAMLLGGVFAFRLVFSLIMMKPMNRASKTASDSSSHLSGKIIDSISNYSIVKLFAGTRQEKQHLEPPRAKNIRDRIHASFFQRIFWTVPMFVWDMAFGLTMLLCATLYVSGEMKISDVVFTMSIYFSVSSAISNIVNQIPDMVDVISSAQKSYEELVKPIEIQDIPGAAALCVQTGKIEIKGVSFKYSRRQVLDNLSLIIRPGEKVGLVGTSGAGKTTLVNLLMRFYDPVKGAILIDDQDISTVTQNSLRENIAFIPQEPTMFNRTLKENIGYGRPGATDAEIRRAAKRASADGFIMEAPKKYDSLVGDRGIKLSGGQRQRIAIARAFLRNAPILILDEATAALDSETEATIQKSFEELSKGRTTIAIAHRLSTLRNMDRIVVLDRGRVVENGSHSALLKKKGIYARLWKMQSGGFIRD